VGEAADDKEGEEEDLTGIVVFFFMRMA